MNGSGNAIGGAARQLGVFQADSRSVGTIPLWMSRAFVDSGSRGMFTGNFFLLHPLFLSLSLAPPSFVPMGLLVLSRRRVSTDKRRETSSCRAFVSFNVLLTSFLLCSATLCVNFHVTFYLLSCRYVLICGYDLLDVPSILVQMIQLGLFRYFNKKMESEISSVLGQVLSRFCGIGG